MTETLSPATYLARASDLAEIARHVEALQVLSQGLGAFPGDPELLCKVATVHLARGDLAQASSACHSALRSAPNRPRPHAVMAEVHLRTEQPAEAERHAREALRLAPDYPYAAQIHVLALARLDRVDEATRAANEMVAQRPDDVAGHLAHVHIALRQTRKLQIRPWVLLLVTVATRGGALLFLGLRSLYHRTRNWRLLAQADSHMAQALRIAPNDPSVLDAAGAVLELKGRWFVALDRRVAAARHDLAGTDVNALVSSVRRRLGVGELIVVVLVAYGMAIGAEAGGPLGLLIAFALLAVPASWWAWDRRRRSVRILPSGLHGDLHRSVLLWLGPAAALLAAAPFAVYLVRSL